MCHSSSSSKIDVIKSDGFLHKSMELSQEREILNITSFSYGFIGDRTKLLAINKFYLHK